MRDASLTFQKEARPLRRRLADIQGSAAPGVSHA